MSNILRYKDYSASITYDADTKTLEGKIDGIKDSVSFKSASIENLETEFHAAVDEYLRVLDEIKKITVKEGCHIFLKYVSLQNSSESNINEKEAEEPNESGINEKKVYNTTTTCSSDGCGTCLVSRTSVSSSGIDSCWDHKESCSIYQEKKRRGDMNWFPPGSWS